MVENISGAAAFRTRPGANYLNVESDRVADERDGSRTAGGPAHYHGEPGEHHDMEARRCKRWSTTPIPD